MIPMRAGAHELQRASTPALCFTGVNDSMWLAQSPGNNTIQTLKMFAAPEHFEPHAPDRPRPRPPQHRPRAFPAQKPPSCGSSAASSRPGPPSQLSTAIPGQPSAYFAGSVTFRTWSAPTFCSVCTIPEGQWISTDSARLSPARPKCTGPSLDEAYPALVVMWLY